MKLLLKFKGGAGSGFYGHKGRIGQVGGSSASHITEALDAVQKMVLSSANNNIQLSDKAKQFLHKTVTQDSYELYRGIGLVRDRYDLDKAKTFKVGDSLPEDLANRGRYSSYSAKQSVTNWYMHGKISLVAKAVVPKSGILVDTRNLRKLLKSEGLENYFTEDDYKYFKNEAEVIVEDPGNNVTIIKIK